MRTEKLDIDCSIRGVDAKEISSAKKAQMLRLLYVHRPIVLKDQHIDEHDYCTFAHAIGSPKPYLQEHYRHPDFPLIFVSPNLEDAGGRKIGVARTGGYWH